MGCPAFSEVSVEYLRNKSMFRLYWVVLHNTRRSSRGNTFVASVGTTHRESIASKTDTPLFISFALHPAKPSINAGFCSYLLTNEEIGTTSNPSCSARRVKAWAEDSAYLPQLIEEEAIHGVPCRGNHILMTIQREGLRCVGNVAGAHSPERRTRCCV